MVLGSLCCAAVYAQPLRVCVTEWPPYQYTRDGVVRGVHTGLVVEAFRRLGMEPQVESVAWERCWNELAKGRYQAIFSASYNEERAARVLYPKTPLQRVAYMAVVRKGTVWDGASLAALPAPLAIPRGYNVGRDLRKQGLAVDDGALQDRQNLEKLVAGRVGTAVIEDAAAKLLIRDMGLGDKVEILPKPVSEKDYFVVLARQLDGSSAKAQTLLERLEAVLQDLRKERRLEAWTREEMAL
ncbi:ABC-type amino acid transporter substrate-binding protein [Candidatus Symbiobacter mobilis CR]|uniref:ABC-type amino acid transporter substrate-binding protein n=2 Tax=Candidatus Symbiobacter TaxID=1436289 RepID=U5NCZ2_9BURK|nr:ABC-type amino acid transporter substrate-binding protein [Candidatus Symbiobacter mobilis CR]